MAAVDWPLVAPVRGSDASQSLICAWNKEKPDMMIYITHTRVRTHMHRLHTLNCYLDCCQMTTDDFSWMVFACYIIKCWHHRPSK